MDIFESARRDLARIRATYIVGLEPVYAHWSRSSYPARRILAAQAIADVDLLVQRLRQTRDRQYELMARSGMKQDVRAFQALLLGADDVMRSILSQFTSQELVMLVKELSEGNKDIWTADLQAH